MRNQLSRKLLLLPASLFLIGATAYAQSTGSPAQPSMPSQQPMASPGATTDAGAPNAQALDDQAFLRKAMQGDDAEVQLGQLAQQKSQSPDVKQFGEKMVQDHTQLGEKVVMPVAQALGVKQPKGISKKDKQLIATLEPLSGPQFDQEYIKAMVKNHNEDLKEFKSEAEMSQDPNVKKAAEEGATLIAQHLQLIQQIAQKHNIETASK